MPVAPHQLPRTQLMSSRVPSRGRNTWREGDEVLESLDGWKGRCSKADVADQARGIEDHRPGECGNA